MGPMSCGSHWNSYATQLERYFLAFRFAVEFCPIQQGRGQIKQFMNLLSKMCFMYDHCQHCVLCFATIIQNQSCNPTRQFHLRIIRESIYRPTQCRRSVDDLKHKSCGSHEIYLYSIPDVLTLDYHPTIRHARSVLDPYLRYPLVLELLHIIDNLEM